MSLYTDLKDAGIEIDHHEADLYFPVSPLTTEILNRYELQKKNAQKFRSQIDGRLFYDVPFGFDPFWENKAKIYGGAK